MTSACLAYKRDDGPGDYWPWCYLNAGHEGEHEAADPTGPFHSTVRWARTLNVKLSWLGGEECTH